MRVVASAIEIERRLAFLTVRRRRGISNFYFFVITFYSPAQEGVSPEGSASQKLCCGQNALPPLYCSITCAFFLLHLSTQDKAPSLLRSILSTCIFDRYTYTSTPKPNNVICYRCVGEARVWARPTSVPRTDQLRINRAWK